MHWTLTCIAICPSGRWSIKPRSRATTTSSCRRVKTSFEREGIKLDIQAHPYDFCERNNESVDIIRGLDCDWINYLYAAPHTFFYDDGVGDIASMLRYIVNPPGVTATVHQHLDIGQGEVNREAFFSTLRDIKFDGIATVAVFAWEERADESSRFMLERVKSDLLR
ncbi:TIM barrel protein [Pseudomonas syringae pv. actinidiae]|uniref:TIM barrel protein n=2 Tax=Pseudomonas syringae TaxID=317 RepID=UPI001E5F7D9B|nr:TIM barrel protein [Pseudomonas syringae]MDG6383472.1 TIM barrel protein [Pseudomonas syringae]MDG6396526.1 TIM barrel protein [Pseudomonas syringae pv. actinidiae]MDG6414900.1 TIM barrel protein [Pseudomonas syringae pv. actinidiae]MDG6420343.1 TIM barrel protein [Pseudomonas syringae pv. actinidiae]MDG6425789.1 TIM barrel protein [Pseudomonas syringae pv. actinidiae]